MAPTKAETPTIVVPVLEGWLTAKQAAEELGISRQSVARMMDTGVFATIHAVGDRPLYVIRAEEVDAYRQLYDKHLSWPKAAEALKDERFQWVEGSLHSRVGRR